MTKLTAYLAAGALLWSLPCAGSAGAMSIESFARMNDDDDATLVTLLVEGAAKTLREQGKPEEALKAINLFKDSSKEGGLNQLVLNLKTLNALNNRNAIKPANRVTALDVEDALALTLKDNGLLVSADILRRIDANFTPVGPMRQQSSGP
jgi:hypothetical protein